MQYGFDVHGLERGAAYRFRVLVANDLGYSQTWSEVSDAVQAQQMPLPQLGRASWRPPAGHTGTDAAALKAPQLRHMQEPDQYFTKKILAYKEHDRVGFFQTILTILLQT